MKLKTLFKTQAEYQKEILEIFDVLLNQYKNIKQPLTENFVIAQKNSYHFLTQLLKPNLLNRIETSLQSAIYRDSYKTEILSAGSSEFAFLFAVIFGKKFIEEFKTDSLNETELLKMFESSMNKLKLFIEQSSNSVKQKDLENYIGLVCREDYALKEACIKALEVAGLEGKIFVENSNKGVDKYLIEFKEGYNFKLQCFPFFLPTTKTWEQYEVRSLVVDGFIESVSEISHLLNANLESKEPMIFVSQGFSEEVISTLVLNNKKDNTNIIPLRLVNDITSINVINDIGVVCGMDPITTLKGQLLTFVKYSDCPVVSKVIINEYNTAIETTKTKNAVLAQVKNLLIKRNENSYLEDVQQLIDNRIRSLTPNTIVLNLPNTSTIENDAKRVKLDLCFRQTKTLLNSGVFDKRNLSNLPKAENEFEKIVFDSFKETIEQSFNNKNPSLSVYLGCSIVGKSILMLLMSKGFVELEASNFDYY